MRSLLFDQRLIAQYSITSKLSDIGVMNHFKGPLAPLVFDLNRLHESPTSFTSHNSPSVVKGLSENGRSGLMRYPAGPSPGANATCCSSSSSLSLSSGSCGAIFANSAASVNNPLLLLLNANAAGGPNVSPSSAISIGAGGSSAARHPNTSPCTLSQLKENEVQTPGLFEESNKADSGYKSDHVRIFDLPPPSRDIEATEVISGQRSSVTPPLPPPVDFDSLTKKSTEDFFSASLDTTPTTTASSTVERESDRLGLPHLISPVSAFNFVSITCYESCIGGCVTYAGSIANDDSRDMLVDAKEENFRDTGAAKLFEILSRRRAMLRTNWDYEANEYDEGDEEEEAVEEGEQDDFMEVADAVTLSKIGGGASSSAVLAAALMTEARQQKEASASTRIKALGTGSGLENEAAEEEDEDTSDEGLLTVRRVLPQAQAQPLRTAPPVLSPPPAATEVGLSRLSVDGEAGKPAVSQNYRDVLGAAMASLASLGTSGQETDELEISASTDQLVRAAKLQGSRFSPARMLQSQVVITVAVFIGILLFYLLEDEPSAFGASKSPNLTTKFQAFNLSYYSVEAAAIVLGASHTVVVTLMPATVTQKPEVLKDSPILGKADAVYTDLCMWRSVEDSGGKLWAGKRLGRCGWMPRLQITYTHLPSAHSFHPDVFF
ncbi:unnamed protein product [Schistocephalus solidus]|uniref:Protein kinase domain-containing protein n=1 Tax=Schistocephalus solidus TaxID=70667 RepID=A0A183SEW0_SCHSO|nr:unnamed protein product [Schistocephalus solidus]